MRFTHYFWITQKIANNKGQKVWFAFLTVLQGFYIWEVTFKWLIIVSTKKESANHRNA